MGCFGNLFCRWYSSVAEIPEGWVGLPLRLSQTDGATLEKVHDTAITWPWDVLNWLYRNEKLFHWASNDPNPEKVREMNREYWTRLGHEESVKLLDLKDPARTFPIFLARRWCASIQTSEVLGIFVFLCIEERPFLVLQALASACARNTFSETEDARPDRGGGGLDTTCSSGWEISGQRHNGQAWPVGSREEGLANLDFAGGYKCAFSAFKGDWEARVLIHKLQRSYNHTNICEHCPACKSNTAFNYRNFSPDAAYLDVPFTHAQYLVMTPQEFHSSWLNVEEPLFCCMIARMLNQISLCMLSEPFDISLCSLCF